MNYLNVIREVRFFRLALFSGLLFLTVMIKKWLISDLIPRLIFQKFHGQKISKSRVLGQFWRLEIIVKIYIMVYKIVP